MSEFHKKIKQGRWLALRDFILRRDKFTCQACGRRGIALIAEIDHITPLQWGGAPHDPANLQSLCKPCHFEKTGRERRTGPPENQAGHTKADAWADFRDELIA